MEIKINPKFRDKVPPLQPEEFSQLEENIVQYGCREPLVVWNNFIVDGHNRYEICTKHNIPFKTKEEQFESEQDAIIFIIKNQLGRRNISAYQRAVLALEFEDIFSEKAKENLSLTGGDKKSGLQNSAKPIIEQVDTRKEVAKLANLSHDTIMKVKKIQEKATPEMKEQLTNKDKSINEVFKEIRIAERKDNIRKLEEEHRADTLGVSEFDIDINTTDRKFKIIYADPAWSYWEGGHKNQSLHYQTMGIDDICNLPIERIADDNSILFLWVTFPILQEAFRVIESWGFTYSTCGFVWVKRNKNSEGYFFGNGSWTRANAELCLIGTRGSVARASANISQILDDRVAEHSAKPKRVRGLITDLVGELPRIELFSRNTDKDGWFNWGNKI